VPRHVPGRCKPKSINGSTDTGVKQFGTWIGVRYGAAHPGCRLSSRIQVEWPKRPQVPLLTSRSLCHMVRPQCGMESGTVHEWGACPGCHRLASGSFCKTSEMRCTKNFSPAGERCRPSADGAGTSLQPAWRASPVQISSTPQSEGRGKPERKSLQCASPSMSL
jgi:hypothetical protein